VKLDKEVTFLWVTIKIKRSFSSQNVGIS